MTIKINYLDNGRGIEIIACDCVTGDEIIAAHQEIYSDENLKKQKYQIIDRTNCTKYQVSPEDIHKIATIDNTASKTNPNIIIAMIAPTNLQYGMSRMWQMYTEESKFKTCVFRERKDAEKWINLLLKNSNPPDY